MSKLPASFRNDKSIIDTRILPGMKPQSILAGPWHIAINPAVIHSSITNTHAIRPRMRKYDAIHKMKVNNILQCCQKRTEPWPHAQKN